MARLEDRWYHRIEHWQGAQILELAKATYTTGLDRTIDIGYEFCDLGKMLEMIKRAQMLIKQLKRRQAIRGSMMRLVISIASGIIEEG